MYVYSLVFYQGHVYEVKYRILIYLVIFLKKNMTIYMIYKERSEIL